ncbi:MAG: arsenite-translocating ATPase ArsA, partial [Sporolactobacillus laevolacticus]|nr:arsenite-translocating ATPase ArsA [Sporolactobacillus laevolacticus]
QALADRKRTTLMLVTRPDRSALAEAARASKELRNIGIENQYLLVNGRMRESIEADSLAVAFIEREQQALTHLPIELKNIPAFDLFLAPFNMTGVTNIRRLFSMEYSNETVQTSHYDQNKIIQYPGLNVVIDQLLKQKQRIIFTMGKGGVGKTTIARSIAVGLAAYGNKVHLTTTDPAGHLDELMSGEIGNITVSRIDPKKEVERYRQEVINHSKDQLDSEGLAYLEEDLRSPCTEEIAVFRAFADVVERANDEIVVIDTAPSGHTLLLLDAAEAYHRDIAHASGKVPVSVKNLLPRLRNSDQTAVIIVTLAETTPVFESERLAADLERAGITPKWWVVNQSLAAAKTIHPVLQIRAANEHAWIERVAIDSEDHMAVVPWHE